ncbi:MAG: hypothetical protein LC790_12835 [Actinobacteria bacterium]|nr:hypothetical protein [Actinomycetota bacterium]
MRSTIQTPLRIGGALATLAAATLLTAAPAQAVGKTSAACASQFTSTISPGFSTAPSSGTQTTNGETGTVTCVGKIAGRRITGIGSIGYDSTYTAGTCASETASGTVRATIPTAAGDQHLVGALTVQRTALAIRAQVKFGGFQYTGIGVAIPIEGNCFLTPLRRALIVLTGTLSSK